MALRVANSTSMVASSTNWDRVTNTPTISAGTNIDITGGNQFTVAFTAPNTTNACTGVALFCAGIGTAGTITATLQQSTVDTTATSTINVSDLPFVSSSVGLTGGWVYFRFASPFTFTTTGANAYRFKIVGASLTGTTSFASDSGGSNMAYLATDNRTAAPSTTADDCLILGHNITTTVTVTVDGSRQWGSRTDTGTGNSRSIGNATYIGKGGKLVWDTAANSQLTCRGTFCNAYGGEVNIGSVATPIPAGQTGKLIFSMGATNQAHVFNAGRFIIQGAPQTSTSLWKTKYVSGAGTAVSPLVTSTSVDWAVGDQIQITSTSGSAETETRFIITKNSATSYVVSTTAGGAEAALTYTHTTDADIINIQRNAIITSDNSSFYWSLRNFQNIDGDFNWDWFRVEYCGASNTVSQGFLATGIFSVYAELDYGVNYANNFRGFIWSFSTRKQSYTGLVVTNSTSSGGNIGLYLSSGSSNKTFTDCFVLNQSNGGFAVDSSANITANNIRCISNGLVTANSVGSLNLAAAVNFNGSGLEVHANAGYGINLSTTTGVVSNSNIGTKGVNVTCDINCIDDSYNSLFFDNSNFGSSTLLNNYANMSRGGEITFFKFNGTANKHFWYTDAGKAEATGTGLSDTTVRTANSLGLKITPEDATDGFVWETLIPAIPSSSVFVSGYLEKDSTYSTNVAKIELFLPGSAVADASYTFPDTTGSYLPFMVSAYYSGTVTLYATVRVTALSVAGSIYLDDFYDAGTNNKVAGFDLWYRGKPAPVFAALDVSAVPGLVWAYPTANLTASGTTGKMLVDTNGDAELAAIKP